MERRNLAFAAAAFTEQHPPLLLLPLLGSKASNAQPMRGGEGDNKHGERVKMLEQQQQHQQLQQRWKVQQWRRFQQQQQQRQQLQQRQGMQEQLWKQPQQ
jgi:hypothetical protein